ncbi:MAG: SpoIIE family protein phosphatase [bacterium]
MRRNPIAPDRTDDPPRRSGRIGPRLAAAASLCLVAAAFLVDYLTGNEISSSLYYVVAVAFGAWFLGRNPGLGLAVLSTVGWWLAYLLTGNLFSRPGILAWNLAVELAIYVSAAVAVSGARGGLERERRLALRLDQANRALDLEARAVGDLQRQLLPRAAPALPGYLWETHYATSTRAGGDYFDFFPLTDGRLGILVADASGHGAAAAVLMAMTRVLLHSPSETLFPPDRVLARLHVQLAPSLPESWFVTACYAILDPPTGRLEYALAGHPPPIVLRAGRPLEALPLVGGPPLGLLAGPPSFTSGAVELGGDDTLLIYTDGLTEAMNTQGDLFGEERLHAVLERVRTFDLRQMRSELLASVEKHAAGAPLADDLTLLLLRRSGPSRSGGGAEALDESVRRLGDEARERDRSPAPRAGVAVADVLRVPRAQERGGRHGDADVLRRNAAALERRREEGADRLREGRVRKEAVAKRVGGPGLGGHAGPSPA